MGRTRNFYLQLGFTLLVCAFLILPVLMSIVAGFTENFFIGVKSGLTLRWIVVVWDLYAPTIFRSMYIALALILTYGGFRDFRTSWMFILVGHVLYTLPFMVRSVLAVLSSFDFRILEESAASLGAGFRRRFLGIVVPNARSGIVAGSLTVVTLSIGEFNLTWMLHTPETMTLPVGLADSYASMRLEIGSAYTLVFFVMIIPLLIALQRYGTQRIKKVGRA